MSTFLSIFLILIICIAAFKFFAAISIYEKILSFYFLFTNFIILILLNAITNFDAMLDIIIVLFLLQLVAVLFLLFNYKKLS